jgi:hypothetical protein
MKYTVVWQPSAIQELAALWLTSGNRDELTAAANGIDVALRDSAIARGDERPGDLGELVIGPLGVDFVLSRDDRKVVVSTVWRNSERS